MFINSFQDKIAAKEALWNQSRKGTLFTTVFAFEHATGVRTYPTTQASLSDSSLGFHSGSALAESSSRSPFNEIYHHVKQREILKMQYKMVKRMESCHHKLSWQRLGQRSMKAACSNLRDSLGRCLEKQLLLKTALSSTPCHEDGMELGSSSPYLIT